jgi:non-specific serine/threonine protein kinase
MHELTITPEGHLLVRETSLTTSDRDPSKRLLEAYGKARRRMLLSATEEITRRTATVRVIDRSPGFITNLCPPPSRRPAGPYPNSPSTDLKRAVLQAPPMTGRYLSEQALGNWWRDLDSLARARSNHRRYARLSTSRPAVATIGRDVTLAENKRNPDYPFAFLATFVTV